MTDPTDVHDRATRVLVFAPVGRDADLTHAFLAQAGIAHVVCGSVADLCDVLERDGAGALLLTEEALHDRDCSRLATMLEQQPSWSDVPVLLFAGRPTGDVTLRSISPVESLRNVILLERPLRVAGILSAIRTALRARTRQYEVRDLLVELRAARAEAEAANRLKDEFLATLSHELRTPLNAILGWTAMLTRGQVDAARLPRVFETLDRNARAQAQLIADVLDVSRIISGKLELHLQTVDLCELVIQAIESVRMAAASKDIQLSVEHTPPCAVRGDVGRLQQVVWNILSNAIKFTSPGGSIRVTVAREGPDIAVSVSDTGVGIAPQFLSQVFDRFRQADQSSTRVHGGLGLGLSIVKHLVELHGGTVTASSQGLGHGACFLVRLPALDADAEQASPTPPVPEHDVSLAGTAVLVVDDDPSTREVVAAELEQAGADVMVAASAADGWTMLHARRPDVLVVDLAMPTEDGFSFLRRVRTADGVIRSLPAVALSAFADPQSESDAIAAGFTTSLAKPAQPAVLVELVARLNEVKTSDGPSASKAS